MGRPALSADPFNLIITGVGGQGNVLASKLLGRILVAKGFTVTIGETFGASQRGGSVASHLRVSADSVWSPQVPRGRAHAVVALEPVEALRVLGVYGNPEVVVISNTRPIHTLGVASGEQAYPQKARISEWLGQYARRAWLIPATDIAMQLGSPIFGNLVMIGALAGAELLPFERSDFKAAMDATLPAERVEANLRAFDLGRDHLTGRAQLPEQDRSASE
jgi:indolepyruvate ferredoxin oxidoreductase beta subunit